MRALLPKLVVLTVALAVLPAQAQIAFRAASSATAAGVTPAFRAAASAATTSATLTINKPSGTATNDVLVASIAVTPSSVTITPPSGWTLVRRMDNAGPTSNSLAVYWKAAIAGEPASYAWGVSGASFAVGGVQAFSGIDAANPIDVENGQNTPSATTHAAPTVTSNAANTMLVASHAFASSRTWTPPSGMTESFDRPSGANSATGLSVEGSRVLMATAGSSGTKTATAAGNADAGNAHLLALRPASANLAISTPSGTSAGDVMIAAIGFNNAGAAITAPAGWTLVRRMNNTSTTSNALAVYRKSAAGGEPSSHIWGVAGGAFLVGGIQSFSGVDGANPIDAESGQSTASGTNHDTPSVTTSTANTMLVTSHTYASAQSWTPQAGLTESFERLSSSASATGQSITGTRQAQAAAGMSGTKRSTAASSADVGNTHILALRQLQPQVQALHFIHVDHLNTPRLVANQSGQTVWRWDQQEPFGVNVPDENPSDLGVFDLPLRLPGQYFDKETNVHYNYFRDYDPGIGRYVQSDPIGLRGGLNTYAYVTSRPLHATDVLGLAIWICNREVQGFPWSGNHAYIWDDRTRKACSMRGSSGVGASSENERGPSRPGFDGDSCVEIPGSPGKENQIMDCCRTTANNGFWFPWANDCHSAADKCIGKAGLRSPGAPGGRTGECDSCQPGGSKDTFHGAP